MAQHVRILNRTFSSTTVDKFNLCEKVGGVKIFIHVPLTMQSLKNSIFLKLLYFPKGNCIEK